MGCNFYRYEKENNEFHPFDNNKKTKKNKNNLSYFDNKPDLKTNVSSPNLEVNNEKILNNLNNYSINNNNNKNNNINNINKDNNYNINNDNNNNYNNEIYNNSNKNIIYKNDDNIINNNVNLNNINSKIIYKKSKIDTGGKSLFFDKADYNTRIIDLINELRLCPEIFADIILDNIRYISKERKIIGNDETGQNEEILETVFQKKVKVKINEGERAFINAANIIRQIQPMDELILKEEIKLDCPGNEEEMNDNSFIKNQLNLLRKKNNITAFFKDYVKNPEIGLLLMIVGDNENGQNKKRNALLNPENKYIGVNSKFIGDTFVAYFTFSK